MNILIVEDENITRKTLSDLLRKEGHSTDTAAEGEAGIRLLKQKRYDVVITDLRLPRRDGMQVLDEAKKSNPDSEVIVITAYASVETAVQALKNGAYDYVTKPLTPEKFLILIRNIDGFRQVRSENEVLRKRLDDIENKAMIGSSAVMRKLTETIRNVAVHDYTVLIQGESGTGKEVTARALHRYSSRSDKPFVAVNCAAIPESLLESELFGHEEGAFSGAVSRHTGYFERAHGGTLFIDDIDDFPLHLQVKLLRILQERQFYRVGGTESIQLDVRIIGATKVELQQMVREKKFREDLYYRLHIIPLTLPPLRDRREDIPELAQHFFQKRGAEALMRELPVDFFETLCAFNWPGNVRQLENIIERIIATEDLGIVSRLKDTDQHNSLTDSSVPDTPSQLSTYPSYETFMTEKEYEILQWALRKTEHNISRAAALLELPRGTLRSKLERYKDRLS
ncbi:two component, sigma54 specific, transcriptional regulator, Fis family [Cyclonatronum proteinivorum]|uniref:Two component, sigma54 specific, transcriptional regulator, Fis family n=1 Tax=Cyclonatronum proteinivorum TaxID=1457365 RepID=A0A345UJR2_9BACT|nr:sigma-54 dependent transcriptional regulator [Cyclonatronum proteinivorum]AXJ00714.1 two component, sigma54 specific, transcriptional regulator, Fis family [Cyclonatronum proteinivorum]